MSFTEGKSQDELEAEEQEEEEEAKNIQKRLAANLSEEDYDLNFFKVSCLYESAYACSLDITEVVILICLLQLFVFLYPNEGICYGREG